MKITLFGHGKMGRAIEKVALERGYLVVEPLLADVCIDFSHADAVMKHCQWAATHGKALIIGTTGWSGQQALVKGVVEESGIAALASSNFSLGMAFFTKILEKARSLLKGYDVAGIEYHHAQKKDAPSGTAKSLAQILEMEKEFTSVRCGAITGKHEVIFHSPSDSITLIHEAHNREIFAEGALLAAQWIKNKKGWFTLDDMLKSLYGAHYPF